MSRFKLVVLAALLAAGCRKVEKAPADLDQIQPWLWDNYTPAADSDYADALRKFDAFDTVKGVASGMEFTGSITSHLSTDSISPLPLTGVDPKTAPGIILIDEMPCTLDQVEPLIYATNQDQIHANTYTSYERHYESDTALNDYKDRKSPTLKWFTTYKLKDLNYTAHITGEIRRIPDQGKDVTPYGAFIIGRAWLSEPAKFDSAGNQYFKQDYQLEIYYERKPGHVVHQFVDWRDSLFTEFSMDFKSDNTTYQSFVLNNDITWDNDVASRCGK